jgi:hypothetical protein
MRTTYQCRECQAEDHDNGLTGTPPRALICWNCRKGRGMGIDDQVVARTGMLPVSQEQD